MGVPVRRLRLRLVSVPPLVAAALLWALGSPAGHLGAQERPLPEQQAFFGETQENLERARQTQFWFAYTERATEFRRNPFGRVGSSAVTKSYAVWPELDPPTIVRQLIAEDGIPVADGEVERIELESRRREDDDDEPRRSAVEDTMAVLRFVMERRERIGGRDMVVVRFEPRPDEEPQTREGEWAKKFAGAIWIDEAAREVARVEATTLDSISLGLGLVARLGKGATVTLEREPVDGDVWMPTSVHFRGEGRAFLFLRRLTVDHVVEWFDYDHLTREEVERASR